MFTDNNNEEIFSFLLSFSCYQHEHQRHIVYVTALDVNELELLNHGALTETSKSWQTFKLVKFRACTQWCDLSLLKITSEFTSFI